MSVRNYVAEQLWGSVEPISPSHLRESDHVDLQGWNSHHRYLAQAVRDIRPAVVVEVGVWKGGSAITLAEALRDNAIDGTVIAIDTWLGSSEHFIDYKKHGKDLKNEQGYPRLYYTFLANVLEKNVKDYMVPLPLDSVNAFHVLKAKGIQPDVLHIDAGHDFDSATNDLRMWWPALAPGGILVGDDYFADGSIWPEVKRAFDTFFGQNPCTVFESADAKVIIKKPV